MRHTVHQTFIDLSSDTFLLFLKSGRLSFFIAVIDCNLSALCFFNQLFRFVNSIGNLRDNDWFSIKSRHFYIFIGCHNDTVTICDILCRQYIFVSAGAVCLHLDRISHLFCRVFKTFRRHISMCDSGRTGRNCKNLISLFLFFLLFFLRLLFKLFFFRLIDIS